ncbi:alpha/beta hydrolase family protein [Marinobacter zhejiangensis]|uniref:ABC-2 type transport system ATP-binding protein n=1 Tax=Marinobacter zhejiangensis TaxID=488535 RepID=A0A1I4N6Q8_9GAMM|nr:alpha/beta fold hydrolase [Marinobacter zhejiangensis]SFM11232.1 ABC-2 type transport system ATP-binding protein [Marinobacter zhejiangensis]
MKSPIAAALLGASTLFLGACGGGSDGSNPETSAPARSSNPEQPLVAGETISKAPARPLPESLAALEPASCGQQQLPDGGQHYRVEMPSRVDGAAIVFEVFEPVQIDCQNKHPLILQGHGFSGSRSTEAGNDPLSPIQPLLDAGYAVISIDQRGHGESGGTVRVMDPDYAGEDLVQIVDWAEANLDFLKYRQNNLLLGAVGGSYGGGFQYLLYNVDPDQRMDAMVPQITWHDLTYSLNPGDTTKNYWLLFLSLMGDAGSGGSMDPLLRSSILDGLLQNRFPEPMLDFVHYHSPSYFFDNERELEVLDSGNTQSYLLDPITGQIPLTADGRYIIKTPRTNQYPVDVLMFQGMRDSLFPFNEAYENYLSMKDAGGDVRLLTYPFGHHYLAPSAGLIQETLENLGFYGSVLPEFPEQGLGGLANCGSINVNAATVAWFNEKLLGQGNADDVITSGQQICYTLAPGDSVTAPDVTVGGESFDITTPVLGTPVPVLLGANPIPVMVPLTSVTEDGVIAGIPTATLTMGTGVAELDALCLDESDPILHLGTCDAMMFVGVGIIRNGFAVPELIDEQVMPVRGFGEHNVELVGIAERLSAGDQLVLMLYGQHPTFVGAFSRDLTSWLVQVSGQVSLPLLSPNGQQPL